MAVDDRGFVVTGKGAGQPLETSVPGVFAIGDVRAGSVKRVGGAIGEGAAAVAQFDGQVSTFKPFDKRPDGEPYPTYRCLHPEAPPPGLLPACEEAGIIGALTGIIGSIQAMEVMKEILGIGESLAGRLFMYDALGTRAYVSELRWDPGNPLNGRNPTIRDLSIDG